MAISWKLKTYLSQKHSIYKALDLQRAIVNKTGVKMSLQNVCNYLNIKPKSLRMETVELICTTLNCQLSDFCQVSPSHNKKAKNKKLSYKNTPNCKRGTLSFPNPEDYQ
jgi:DNA-binding Xre family transcriptional regulator